MEKSTPESTTQRPGRGTRGARILALRGTQSGRSTSPRNKSPASKPPTEEKTRPIRGAQSGSRGSRILRPRGRGRVMRRENRPRPRQPNFRRRLERAQFAVRNPRGNRGRFRGRRGYFGMFRRFFRRRSIFIKGFPKDITEKTITNMLEKEGRVLRVTLLKDSRGESRGMAFAEFQNPRDASKAVQKSKLKQFEGFDIFVTFKRDNNRFRNNYSRFFGRNRNNRPLNGFRPGFNQNRFQRQMRPLRNIIRGGRGRGRGSGRGRGRGF